MMERNQFGTTREMVIGEIDDHGLRRIMAIDDKGLYLTDLEKVGRRVADVNRYGVDRAEFVKILEALGYNTTEIFEKNRYRLESRETVVKSEKKVNPLKASKRGL